MKKAPSRSDQELSRQISMMERIKDAWSRVDQEKREEEQRRLEYNLKMKKAQEEKRKKEMSRLKAEEEKRLKISRKLKAEKRWEMSKWIHKYIEDNSLKWERERKRRKEEEEERLKEWEKSTRFEKIQILKEKLRKNQEYPKT